MSTKTRLERAARAAGISTPVVDVQINRTGESWRYTLFENLDGVLMFVMTWLGAESAVRGAPVYCPFYLAERRYGLADWRQLSPTEHAQIRAA